MSKLILRSASTTANAAPERQSSGTWSRSMQMRSASNVTDVAGRSLEVQHSGGAPATANAPWRKSRRAITGALATGDSGFTSAILAPGEYLGANALHAIELNSSQRGEQDCWTPRRNR